MIKGERLTQDEQDVAQKAKLPLVSTDVQKSEHPYSYQQGLVKTEDGLTRRMNEVFEELLAGKDPDLIAKEVAEGKWPFAISADQMRTDLNEWKK